jgi:hypothetical protein
MKKTIRLTESELIKVINTIIQEASHQEKVLPDIFKYIKKNMGCTITETTNGYKVCPPSDLSTECYTMHRGGDKGVYDLLRFLAKTFDLSKHALEIGIINDVKYEKIKQKSIEKGYSPKR